MARSRLLTVWLPIVAWAAVIFTLSSIPSLSTGLGLWDTILRKGAHLTEYAILGALLYRALRHEAPALAAGIAYAGTDELHQHFVRGRHGSESSRASPKSSRGWHSPTWARQSVSRCWKPAPEPASAC